MRRFGAAADSPAISFYMRFCIFAKMPDRFDRQPKAKFKHISESVNLQAKYHGIAA
jgi:hypothetical protein